MIQTDLIMISVFGSDATAAFSIPTNVMFIDLLASFAITPIISVRISKAFSKKEGEREIALTLLVGFFLALCLTAIGFALYPFIVKSIITVPEVKKLGLNFVFWMTLAIIPRFMLFVTGLCLNATKKSKWLILISLVSLVMNYLFNLLFMKFLNYGPVGCYMGTFTVSMLSLFLSLYILKPHLSFIRLSVINVIEWWKKEWKGMGLEISRLSSERAIFFLTFFLINNLTSERSVSLARLAVFSIVSEFVQLVSMPMFSVMRSLPIYLSYEARKIKKQFFIFPLLVASVFSLFFYLFSESIATKFYHLHDSIELSWWIPFSEVFILYYGSLSLGSVARGYFYSKKDFSNIFKLDVVTGWLFFVPMFALGAYFNSPYLLWSGYGIQAFLATAYLIRGMYKNNKYKGYINTALIDSSISNADLKLN